MSNPHQVMVNLDRLYRLKRRLKRSANNDEREKLQARIDALSNNTVEHIRDTPSPVIKPAHAGGYKTK